VVYDLEEALGEARFSDLGCAMFHALLIAGQIVGEVDDGRGFGGRHFGLSWKLGYGD